MYILSPFLFFNLLLFSILLFFCSTLSTCATIILSLFITFTLTPISLPNHSSTPLSIFPLIPLFRFLLFPLFHLFLYNFYPFNPICFLCLSFYFFLSSPFSSLTAADTFLTTFFSSLIPAVSSFISLIMVFISLSISLLLFPSSLLLRDIPVLELFLNEFVPSSGVQPSSLSLLLLYFFTFGDFGMPSLSCPLPSAYHLSLIRRCLR
jgi:hypothetical protein